MKFFLFLSLLTSMFTSCKENTVNPIVIKSDSEKSIMISIENNERIDLKNFIVNFTITNNTDYFIQVHPDYVKLISFDSFEKNIHYSRSTHELNYADTGFIKVHAKQKLEFKNKFDFVANDFLEKNKDKKIDGIYFVYFLYVINNNTYSTGIKQIYLYK